MQVLAPAKINLHLRVGKRRDDGFHPLHTWMCTVALFDKLIFEPAHAPTATTPPPPHRLTCNRPDVPTDHTNLVLKAVAALPAPTRATPLSIHLEKSIPHGAGLGGGSSDATRTLLALNRLWELDLGKDQLLAVASSLGSDTPFFLYEPSALCQGRGEHVTPLPPPRPRHALLLLPPIHMPTPAVFQRFDDMNLGFDTDAPIEEWSRLDSNELLSQLINDLEAPAFSIAPKLQQLQEEAQRRLNRIVRMSGSGSTLFTLFDTADEARSAASQLQTQLNVPAIPVELAPEIRDDLHGDPATR